MAIFDQGGHLLVTAAQAAQLLGVDASAISHARRAGTFPEPAEWVDARTPVWRERDLPLPADPVPAELRKLPRWVRRSPRKVPLQADGTAASSTDPDTWCTHEAARGEAGWPVGFVLNGDGIVCIDLDQCLRVNGSLRFAGELVDRWAARTYVEVSPSGEGLHIWGRGELERGRRVRYAGGKVELYGDGRFITVTGDRFRCAPSLLADVTPLLDEVLKR